MVYFSLADPLHVQIDTENWDYLRAVKDHFSHHIDGYRFNPLVKSGQWDGKISLFNTRERTLPYGLLLELIKYNKKEWSDLHFEMSEDCKGVFRGLTIPYNKNLQFEPYDYQDDCISACLKTSKGIIRSATASGKSLMISYVIKALWESQNMKNGIIIVPSIGLVTQFYEDMADYGLDMSLVGRVGDDWREWGNPITISTWQSLKNVSHKMEGFDAVLVDEVHGAKAKVLSDLLVQSPARWRFGFTGTMPSSKLDQLQVQSYLGPVLREYGSVELAKLGYVSECVINMLYIDYKNKPKGNYNEVKDEVFRNDFRLGLIYDIIQKMDGNMLLLVGKVEDEGEYLKQMIAERPELADYEVEFLSGKDSATDRERWRKYMDKGKNVVLIATYGIFQQGINIKSLSNLILASPFKSKVRILQSIGRTLRLHADKDGAVVWDICDQVKYLTKHSDTRMKHYSMEGFEVVDHYLNESAVLPSDMFEIKGE